MNFSRSNLALFALNATWLAIASYFIARHFHDPTPAPRVEYVTNYVPIAKAARVTVVTNVVAGTNDFRWVQLESEDYRTYIERLRNIGCPEQTIRDIIIADVDKLLAPRLQAASLQPRDLKYWEPFEQTSWDDATQRDAITKQRLIDFEKREVIRELLGVDLIGEKLRSQGHDDYYGSRLQFLPEEKRARVRLVLDQFADKERSLLELQVEEGEGFNPAEDLRALQQQKSSALSQLLTQEERDQYDLWFSPTATRTREAVFGMNATQQEFLKIYDLQRQFDAQYAGSPAPLSAVQQLNFQLQQELGESRYAEFVRAQDADFRDLYATTTRFGLPQKLATELHEFKQAANEQRAQVNADANLTPAQKQAAQQAIQEETQQAFKEALGEKAFRYLSRRSGGRAVK